MKVKLTKAQLEAKVMYDLMDDQVDCQWETPYGAFIIAFQSQQQGAIEHALCPACILAGVVAPPLLPCDCWQDHDFRKYPKPVYKLID